MFNTEISNVNTTLTSSINTINSYLTHVVYGDGANPDAQFRLSRNTVNFTEGFPDGLGNFNLIMKEEDEKRLNKIFDNAAYMNMAGGIQGYQQMAAASAMMDAGEGMKQGGAGGGNMLAGAGLGVGFGMANQFAGAMQYPQQPMQPQAPPPGIPPTQPGGAAAVKCEKCQKMVAPGKFCAECGATMVAAGPKFCGGCGQPVPPGGKFCAGCGNKVA